MINLMTALADLDERNELHMSRILVLMRAFGGRTGRQSFDGLTKLAKLDFLLRYPRFLERALIAKGLDGNRVGLKHHEEKSIESKMIRYHYGPWDPRHRKILNLLIAKGLVQAIEGSPTLLRLTHKGVEIANILNTRESHSDLVERALILADEFHMTGTKLKKFIYKTFPEIVNLRRGEEILYENRVSEP